jgi:hypothetical protein
MIDDGTAVGGVFILGGDVIDPDAEVPLALRFPLGESAGARAGSALAVGRFDDTIGDDLAVGSPREDVLDMTDAGEVIVIYNGDDSSIERFRQGFIPGLDGSTGAGDHVGSALAAGDVDGDSFDDLMVGVPDEDDMTVGADVPNGGQVLVVLGGSDGLQATGQQTIDQRSPGVPGDPVSGGRFGAALAVADVGVSVTTTSGGPAGGVKEDDLAIGVPGDDVDGVDRAGSVVVLYNAGDGLGSTGNQRWTQDSTGIAEAPGARDGFGSSLAVGSYAGLDQPPALAIGVPREDVGSASVRDAGAVHVLFAPASDPDRLSSDGDELWHQDVEGVKEKAQAGDRFGQSLATVRTLAVV